MEASANGCAVIITNKGGLPETVTDAKIISELNVKNLTKNIVDLIKNPKVRKNYKPYQLKFLSHSFFVSKNIDNYRTEKLIQVKKFLNLNKKVLNLTCYKF